MAENKSPTAKVAAKVEDPSVKSLRGASAYPESTHPPVPPSEQAWRPGRFSYTSADQKPDESTVGQELKSDPMQDEVNKALGDHHEHVAAEANKAASEK
ncbi:MAG: hypothetical protein ACJ73L_09730 [Actinomycetes bacterium]